MKINLKHSQSGIVRQCPIGFSWTTLCFGPFPALFRSDVKWFFVILLLALCTCTLSNFIFCFIYNKLYIKSLFENGYIALDESAQTLLQANGFVFSSQISTETSLTNLPHVKQPTRFGVIAGVSILALVFLIIIGILAFRKSNSIIDQFQSLGSGKYSSASAKMLFSPGFQDLMSDNIDTSNARARDKQRLSTQRLSTHLDLLRSQMVIKRVTESLQNKVSPSQILSNLKISHESMEWDGTVITIAYRNSDPEIATAVVNGICRTYMDYIFEVKTKSISALIARLEQEITKDQAELGNKEDTLRELKSANDATQLSPTVNATILRLSREADSLMQAIKDLKTRCEEAKIKRDSQEPDLKILEWAR
jgi:uncharacterized protein involved in exopolysaccharide biosynthesis